MLKFTGSASFLDRGVSMYTFRKASRPEKNSLSLYMSEESSHTTVSCGNIAETGTPPSELSPAMMSGKIDASSLTSRESCVLQSNTLIFSTSSPKNDILKGWLSENEKMSMMEPLTAN